MFETIQTEQILMLLYEKFETQNVWNYSNWTNTERKWDTVSVAKVLQENSRVSGLESVKIETFETFETSEKYIENSTLVQTSKLFSGYLHHFTDNSIQKNCKNSL